jgi:hypothetical protein
VSRNLLEGDAGRRQQREGLKQEIWARTLARITTTFGRLVYLASLRNDTTGLYWDSGLGGHCSDAETNVLLREIHEEVFATWLSFSLKDQSEDLEQYLILLKEEKARDLGTWLTQVPYRKAIPDRAEAAERALFSTNLEFLLDVLRSKLP